MQPTSNLHDQIGNACFSQAQNLFDNAATLDARDGMFDHYAYAGEDPIEKFLSDAQRFPFGLFFGCVVCTPGGS